METTGPGLAASARSCQYALVQSGEGEGATEEECRKTSRGGKNQNAPLKTKSKGAYFSQLIADTSVELLPLHAQEVVSGLQDTALGCDGPGGVDVVSSHHSNSDPGSLALSDGVWYLTKERVKTVHYVRTMKAVELSSDFLLRPKQVADVPPVLLGLQCLLLQYR